MQEQSVDMWILDKACKSVLEEERKQGREREFQRNCLAWARTILVLMGPPQLPKPDLKTFAKLKRIKSLQRLADITVTLLHDPDIQSWDELLGKS